MTPDSAAELKENGKICTRCTESLVRLPGSGVVIFPGLLLVVALRAIFLFARDGESIVLADETAGFRGFDFGSAAAIGFFFVMLFPNTQVRMKMLDKLMIGIPAVVSGVIVISSKLLTSLGLIVLLIAFWLGLRDDGVTIDQAALVALFGGLAAVGGFLVKQYSKFKNRKISFLKTLTDNLYFKNLDNDAGVFHRLLDVAEESESKEAILAYYFLLISKDPISQHDLDGEIETWFAERWDCELNFEVDDALFKLDRHGLVEENNGLFTCRPLDEALARLDAIWDKCFAYRADDPSKRAN